MKIACTVWSDGDLADARKEISQVQKLVETAAGTLAVKVRTAAPRKSGALISGIIPSPWEEKSKYPGKIVRQVYFDANMNDTFVKIAKSGKRYYYPASQEYGFLIANRTGTQTKRVPGKYFMHQTFVEYVPVFVTEAEDLIEKVVSK